MTKEAFEFILEAEELCEKKEGAIWKIRRIGWVIRIHLDAVENPLEIHESSMRYHAEHGLLYNNTRKHSIQSAWYFDVGAFVKVTVEPYRV